MLPSSSGVLAGGGGGAPELRGALPGIESGAPYQPSVASPIGATKMRPCFSSSAGSAFTARKK